MNTPSTDPIKRWETLLRKARADIAPPVDLTALMRAVRAAELPAQAGWLGDLSILFTAWRTIPACLASAGVFALVSAWQLWDVWQALPWAQWVVVTTGGVS